MELFNKMYPDECLGATEVTDKQRREREMEVEK